MIYKINLLWLVILTFISSPAFSEYQSNSVFSDNYKCISDTSGGFNHHKYGHRLTMFENIHEFDLIHISKIPKEALLQIKGVGVYNLKNIDEIRSLFETRSMKQEAFSKDITIEKSSYFLIGLGGSSKKMTSYLGDGCTSTFNKKPVKIECVHSNASPSTFVLNLNTMRFTFSYSGSWHEPDLAHNYFGDSAIFAFGTCVKY